MASKYSNYGLTSLSELYIYTIDSVGIVSSQRLPWFPRTSFNFPRTRANADRREFYSVEWNNLFPQLKHHPTEIIQSKKPMLNPLLHLASLDHSITIFPNSPLLWPAELKQNRSASQFNHCKTKYLQNILE